MTSVSCRSSLRFFALALTWSLLGLTVSFDLAAECSPLHPERIPHPAGISIKIVGESEGTDVDTSAIADGVAMWEGACRAQDGLFHPEGHIPIRIRFHEGANDLEGCGEGCGCTIVNTLPDDDGGEYVASAIIHLFEHYRNGGGNCRSHRAESIAHDIGHALGLRDLEDPYGATCAGRIMSYTPFRNVEADDCRLLEIASQSSSPTPARGLAPRGIRQFWQAK